LRGVDAEGRSLFAGPHSAGWCSVREHGLTFSFDLTRVMFCSGNVTERTRMAAPPTTLEPRTTPAGGGGGGGGAAAAAAAAAAATARAGSGQGRSSTTTTTTASTSPVSAAGPSLLRAGPWDAFLPWPSVAAVRECGSHAARCAAAGGETVVDLYAGIGYYTLPFLVHFGHKVRRDDLCLKFDVHR
jgi:hypothetical protein